MKYKISFVLLFTIIILSGCIGSAGYSVALALRNLAELLCSIYQVLYSIAGPFAVFFLLFAGMKWVGSQDNPRARLEAKKMIEATLIGLIIVLTAVSLVGVLVGKTGYTCGQLLTPA